MITVSLALATICFAGSCHPVLLGDKTPSGVFSLQHARVMDPSYGGDVLAFGRLPSGQPLALHRVWLGNPRQQRLERLAGPATGRRGISGGCINLAPEVFEALRDCCKNDPLIIN